MLYCNNIYLKKGTCHLLQYSIIPKYDVLHEHDACVGLEYFGATEMERY